METASEMGYGRPEMPLHVPRKNRWLWIVLFAFVATLLGLLATGWNVVLIQNYFKMLELAKSLTSRTEELSAPWYLIVLGTLGFLTAIGLLVLFFVRLLREMQLNQLQSEFLAAVSHELKTPIAALELSSSLLRSGGLTEDETERLWLSHQKELHRLREEVEALLEAARWQIQPPSIDRRSRVRLESWLSEATARWNHLLGPGANLRREGEPLECEALLDVRTFNLIADNLLDNARKFARGAPSVVIRTRSIPPKSPRKPARWQIQIQDEGWGFSPTDSKRIFSRFFRAQTHAPHAIPGTGLGLYLARAASRALGLSLRGESAGEGRGATFTIEGRAAPSEMASP
jgi:two-component system phosphate regulon sensor histidine kinase PhoR